MKVYSSGMYVRLAFAVATAVDPDVFILDEALAVGDARFQLACYERIQGMLDRGTTLLFVSHDGNAVKRLCDRALVLEGGRVAFDGAPNDALNAYSRLLFDRDTPPKPKERVAAATEPAGTPAGEGAETPAGAPPETPARGIHAGEETLAGVPLRHRQGPHHQHRRARRGGRSDAALRQQRPHRHPLHGGRRRAGGAPDLRAAHQERPRVEVYGTNTHFQGQILPPLDAGAQVTVEFAYGW
ncbi:MAG: hypothetical protein U0802_14635 [Candidatus Binatia bacterium]